MHGRPRAHGSLQLEWPARPKPNPLDFVAQAADYLPVDSAVDAHNDHPHITSLMHGCP